MDKQKIVWVILSVSIFVVVVLVVGVLLLKQRPSGTETTQTVSPLTDPGTRLYEYSLEGSKTPSVQSKPGGEETMKVTIGEGKETPPPSSPKATAPVVPPWVPPVPLVPPQAPKFSPQVLTEKPREVSPALPETSKIVSAPAPKASAAPRASGAPGAAEPSRLSKAPAASKARAAEARAVEIASTTRARSAEASGASRTRVAEVTRVTATPKKAPSGRMSPRTLRTLEYWIQTGSYKSQSRAEDLAKLLEEKGLAGRVSSYASRRDTYFRVRVGPYTNRLEAEKFLGIVKQIQGLETSYISSVTGTRTVN